MGRTYIVEETVGQYISSINLQGKPFVSGLLIGQCSSQKDYVILATRTPPKEEQNENLKHPKAKLDTLDEEWATEHASQVSRMLPGGLVVLGIFIITALEAADDFQNALRRLIFSVEKSINRKRLWTVTEEEISERVILHICSSTKKYLLFGCLWLMSMVLAPVLVLSGPQHPQCTLLSSPVPQIMCYANHNPTVLSLNVCLNNSFQKTLSLSLKSTLL